MNIELRLDSPETDHDEILQLKKFIIEYGPEIDRIEVPKAPGEPGTQDAGSYLPIIQLILGSTVVAAGVKGLFDVIKNYFDLRKQQLELRKDERKLLFTAEIKGKKVTFECYSFDEAERERFLKIVENAMAN